MIQVFCWYVIGAESYAPEPGCPGTSAGARSVAGDGSRTGAHEGVGACPQPTARVPMQRLLPFSFACVEVGDFDRPRHRRTANDWRVFRETPFAVASCHHEFRTVVNRQPRKSAYLLVRLAMHRANPLWKRKRDTLRDAIASFAKPGGNCRFSLFASKRVHRPQKPRATCT